MKKIIPLAIILGMALSACDSNTTPTNPESSEADTDTTSHVVVRVDYSLGRAMNKRLGKGINLGNAWDGNTYWQGGTLNYDSQNNISDTTYYTVNGETYPVYFTSNDDQYYGNIPLYRYNNCDDCTDGLDASWSNPIQDEYFKLLKDAGFNSVRIPVRWQVHSDPTTHAVNPDRLAGVKEDVQLAIDAGLAVIISFHWYYEISFFASHSDKFPQLYAAEKEHFAHIWTEVATAFKDFPDTMLVYDILNEPTMSQPKYLNEVMTLGYNAIRAVDPNKTIMFESYQSAKFKALTALELPQDGNIIYSGHYYEPYTFSHQGHNSMYACNGDAAYGSSAADDIKDYVLLAMKTYPDVNGKPVPMNMGEFGISSSPVDPCTKKGLSAPSLQKKAYWTQLAIEAAEQYGISWTYWGFVGVGGFEAYDKSAGAWLDGFPAAFGL